MENLKVTSNEEIVSRLFIALPYNVTKHYSAQKGLSTLDFLKDFVLNNQEWSDAFMTESYSLNDVIHDFVGIVSEEEFFVPRISNQNTCFLIDGDDNNRVIDEFDTKEEAMIFVNRKEHSESWENCYETFEDFKDNFFTISSIEMNEAIRTKGSRVKNYWT